MLFATYRTTKKQVVKYIWNHFNLNRTVPGLGSKACPTLAGSSKIIPINEQRKVHMVWGKRFLVFGVLFSFLILAAAPSGWAYPLKVGDIISLSDGPGTTNGGEFKVNLVSPTSASDIFRTFCLEKNEYFSWNQQLTVDGISDYATGGGGGAFVDADGISKDFLRDETKYLYYHFYVKDLTGYHYGDDQSANELQMAIWYLEEELGTYTDFTFNPAFNKFTQLAFNQVSAGNKIGIDKVKVLNLTKPGGNAQDQLTVVPEPGALLSLGIVLLGLGGITRRRFKK